MKNSTAVHLAAVERATAISDVIQKYLDGQEIRFSPVDQRGLPNRDWQRTMGVPIWNFAQYDYEGIPPKPKPVELFVAISDEAKSIIPLGLLAAGEERMVNGVVSAYKKRFADVRVLRMSEVVEITQ